MFNKVFEEASSQAAVFDSVVRPQPTRAISSNTNFTIFAYGQTGIASCRKHVAGVQPSSECPHSRTTQLLRPPDMMHIELGCAGSGKTYTIEGTQASAGIVPQLVHELYARYGVPTVSYVQLYNQQLRELIGPSTGRSLQFSEVSASAAVEPLDACLLQPPTAEQMISVIQQGALLRATSSTEMNNASSRSHSILTLAVGKSQIRVVDLAGSERVHRCDCLLHQCHSI